MILFIDLETTGIYNFRLPADDPSQPHVVELGAILCDENGDEVDRFHSIIKPDGWVIPDVATAVHGISTDKALANGFPIAEVLDGFDALLARAKLLAAFNIRFDDKGLRSERRRLGRPDGFGTVPVFCVMRGATPVLKLPKKSKGGSGEFKTPRLSEAVKLVLEREHVGAHGALADAMATKEIYFKLRNDAEFIAAGSAFKSNENRDAVAN